MRHADTRTLSIETPNKPPFSSPWTLRHKTWLNIPLVRGGVMTPLTAGSSRPFDIGRIVNRTFGAISADLAVIGPLAAIFAALPVAIQAWFQFQIMSVASTMTSSAATAGAGAARSFAAIAGYGMGMLLSVVFAWAMTSFGYAAIVATAMARFDGRS